MSVETAVQALTIGIDARAASHPQPGGFKTYVKSLIEGLAAVDPDNRYCLYVDRPVPDLGATVGERFRVDVIQGQIPVVGPVWCEQALLPLRSVAHRPDVVHFPTGTAPCWHPTPKVVTIHDALAQMPGTLTGGSAHHGGLRRRLMHLYIRYAQRLAARNAVIVITDSEHSRRDLITYLRIPERKIRVIPVAPALPFRSRDLDRPRGDIRSEQSPFILAIASADPRKNLTTLIRAYAVLPPDLIGRFQLRLVWTHRLLVDRLLSLARELGVADRVTSVFTPNDEELCRLYREATAFVFPSLYEGFGLPPLEAMACGAPVIASNTSSMPDVLGDGALLVDPRSVAELTDALQRVLANLDLRRELSRRGLARAGQFSWERTAAQTLSVYREVAHLAAQSGRAEWKGR